MNTNISAGIDNTAIIMPVALLSRGRLVSLDSVDPKSGEVVYVTSSVFNAMVDSSSQKSLYT